jgi:hypothetical protein
VHGRDIQREDALRALPGHDERKRLEAASLSSRRLDRHHAIGAALT